MKVSLAITYKKLVKKSDRTSVTDADYDICLKQLKDNNIDVISKYFEYDDKKRYHLHLLCSGDSKVKYTNLKVKGYSSHCSKCYDVQKWLDYIRKDQKYAIDLSHQITQACMLHDYNTQSDFAGLPSEKRLSNINVSDNEPLTPKEMQIEVPKKRLF